ncbi:MAG: DUF2252 domain-containing protein [Candidatus Nanopelagicales bacterium]
MSLSEERDPIQMLFNQDQTRMPQLVPIRHQRMSESPFAFYRGSAKIMAYDLAQQDAKTPNSGLTVQACGDAHLANFGVYATPERRLVFDVNDFDETLPGPWEWDVKRLAASGVIAAQHNGIEPKKQRKIATAAAEGYAEAMKLFSTMGYREIWDASIDIDLLKSIASSPKESARIEKQSDKAKRRDTMQALKKLTEQDQSGDLRIKSDPPLVIPIRDFEDQLAKGEAQRRIESVYAQYHESLPDHISLLLSRYEPIDMAIKVVGVGSVGTFCFIGLFKGKNDGDPLFLQVKEATDSVLAEYVGPSKYENAGERVVQGQRLIQSSSDMFLGWATSPENRDFYWRQLRDWKWSPNLDTMKYKRLESFMRLCGWTLAHGHARSGDATAISAYLDSQQDFVDQVSQFSIDYSEQNLADYKLFCAAIESDK